MIKAFWATNRIAGMSDEAFYGHWYRVHGRTHGRRTAMRRYVQHHTLPEVRGGHYGVDPTYDGVSVGWFDNAGQMREAFAAPEWDAMRSDAPNLFQPSMAVVYGQERPVIAGEVTSGMVKLMAAARRHPSLTVEEFQRQWFESHGALGARVPGQVRYVQNHPPDEVYGDPWLSAQMTYDAFAEHWYENLDAKKRSLESAEMAGLREHGQDIFDPNAPRVVVVAEETLIVG